MVQGYIGLNVRDVATAQPEGGPFRASTARAEALRGTLVLLALVVLDAAFALISCKVAAALYGLLGTQALPGYNPGTVAASVAAWVGLRALLGLYPGYGLDQVEELRRQTYASLAAGAAMAILLLASHPVEEVGPLALSVAVLPVLAGLLFLAPVLRHFAKVALRRAGLWGKPVVVFGDREAGAGLAHSLEREWQLGLRPVGLFSYRAEPAAEGDDASFDEALADAIARARNLPVDTAVFAMPDAGRERLAGLADAASVGFRCVMVVPNVIGMTNSVAVARDLAGTLGVEFRHNLLDPWSRRSKRLLDLFGVIAGGLAIAPVLLALALLVKLDSQGPIFYGHRRLGAGGRHFRCWKFRTMHADADEVLERHLLEHPELRAEWEETFKLRDDPRVTRVGRFLRKTSLDELPQLWNVLRGEMSLVGPRPIVDAEVGRYGTVYGLYRRIRPGMSGFWQVGGRSDTGYEERVAMDAYYVRNWSVWLDLVVLGRTVACVLLRRGAY